MRKESCCCGNDERFEELDAVCEGWIGLVVGGARGVKYVEVGR